MTQWRVPEWTLADRLRKIRRLTGMSQGEFARAINVPEPRYAAWETGRNQPHSGDLLAVAKRIELLTRVPAVWTLGLSEDGSPGRTRTYKPADQWSDALGDVVWAEPDHTWDRAA